MPTLRVSSDFTIPIPKEVRDALDIVPGQEVQLVPSGDRIELVPLRSMYDARGFLKGISTTIEQEEDRV
ncbi:AbrB/MazE/SpoVT family DNA-binding domain-containing protein [Salinibacter sp.]|uniref:AbrB/MazE/SpoVT family DNA-binding domain-containing protein n=1 Tax=Salinibacter sp. TaxID=2065818 RepID=UPI0021E77FE1|nr:AbrB/MazE/SpoVT family DNA-binding domain-containing protein [Salinibacter sp.]